LFRLLDVSADLLELEKLVHAKIRLRRITVELLLTLSTQDPL